MLPKVIHYCWFGRKPLPPLALKCISSWRKYLPEYEIKEWNEDNFNVDIVPYTQEAYNVKKYAFVSDYARLWVLYNFGGLYFDVDVEVIRSMDDIITRGAFMGCEKEAKLSYLQSTTITVNPGLGIGCCSGLRVYAELLEVYSQLHFIEIGNKLNMKTIVEYTTDLLFQKGMKNVNEIQCVDGIWVYPKDYFCPMKYEDGKLYLTANTYTIHHYAGSWLSPYQQLLLRIERVIGHERLHKFLTIKKNVLKMFKMNLG